MPTFLTSSKAVISVLQLSTLRHREGKWMLTKVTQLESDIQHSFPSSHFTRRKTRQIWVSHYLEGKAEVSRNKTTLPRSLGSLQSWASDWFSKTEPMCSSPNPCYAQPWTLGSCPHPLLPAEKPLCPSLPSLATSWVATLELAHRAMAGMVAQPFGGPAPKRSPL